jgi:8-oxo-dGTP pyrophosphatase MutT (NUDIX family)
MSAIPPWQVRSSRVLLERRWLKVVEQRVVTSSGAEIDEFHLIESPEWVGVVARSDDGRVVMVDQHRHGIGAVSRELPAGVIDPHESPLAAAQRELREETGFVAAAWRPLTVVRPEPSRQNTRAHFFFAAGAVCVGEPAGDNSEHTVVALVPPAALLAALDAGEIVHGVHVGAILMAARRGLLS